MEEGAKEVGLGINEEKTKFMINTRNKVRFKCLRVIGDSPRGTPISNLHVHFRIISIHQIIYHLTDKLFVRCPVHPNPLIRNIGNYTLQDLHPQYTKYKHKRIKHILL
jgi:hypothetical protein